MSNDPYASCLCLASRRLSRLLTHAYDEALLPIGLKVTQFSILVAVDKAGAKDARLSTIAEALDMDPSSLTRALDLLRKSGIVRLEPGEDRRERKARLTPEGRALLEQAMPLWLRAQEQALRRLGADAPAQLANLLAKTRRP